MHTRKTPGIGCLINSLPPLQQKNKHAAYKKTEQQIKPPKMTTNPFYRKYRTTNYKRNYRIVVLGSA
jgi:hypothetical protein